MPDLYEVETGLLSAIAGATFALPLATETGTILTTESGVQLYTDAGNAYLPPQLEAGPGGTQTRLYRGWPGSTDLSHELRQGYAHVTIYADGAMARNTTRYLTSDVDVTTGDAAVPPTLRLQAVSTFVTVNGAPAVGQVCGMLVGTRGAAVGYAYRVIAGDTPALIATALAALIPGATASGAIITLPTDKLVARCVQDGLSAREVRRQEQTFRICVWAPTPQVRDTITSAIDATLAPLSRIVLVTGWTLYQRYRGTSVVDTGGQAGIWRRDLIYTVEYPTTPSVATPRMLFGTMATGPAAPITG